MNLYKKQAFTGLTVCKLVGISHHQFQSFKQAGLIENKHKYTLQDVIYIAFVNTLKKTGKYQWVTILNIFNNVFKSCSFVQNINFLTCEKVAIVLYETGETEAFFAFKDNYENQNLESAQRIESIEFVRFAFYENLLNSDPTLTLSPILSSAFYLKINSDQYFVVYPVKFIEEVIQRSRELELKIDVEKTLKFSIEGEKIIG